LLLHICDLKTSTLVLWALKKEKKKKQQQLKCPTSKIEEKNHTDPLVRRVPVSLRKKKKEEDGFSYIVQCQTVDAQYNSETHRQMQLVNCMYGALRPWIMVWGHHLSVLFFGVWNKILGPPSCVNDSTELRFFWTEQIFFLSVVINIH